MAFTFSGSDAIGSLRDFGNDAANMILQTGATIQQGLQSMMTNRQVAALGQELGTLNPESPEWPQQAIKLGSRYPLAMKSPAGQFMLGTQAKANAEWRQAQQATQQQNSMLQRGIQLENLRTNNDIKLEGIRQKNRLALGGGGVDLLGGGGGELPEGGRMQRMSGMGMIGRGLEMADAAPQEEPAELTGMSGLLPDISSDLAGLAAAQRATGMKPTRAQVASAVASGQTRRQQEKMAERREAQQVEMQQMREAAAEKARLASEERMGRRLDSSVIKTQLSTAERDIAAARRALATFEKQTSLDDREDHTSEEGKEWRRLLQNLEEAGATRTQLMEDLKGLNGEAQEAKKLSREEAAALLKEAGGDKEKARALARERGFTL